MVEFAECKVEKSEKISEGSLDLITSTSLSVKIQIMGRKVCIAGLYQQNFGIQIFVDPTPNNVLPLHLSRP